MQICRGRILEAKITAMQKPWGKNNLGVFKGQKIKVAEAELTMEQQYVMEFKEETTW